MRAHGSQKRASGDPYFAHPLEVAAILTDMRSTTRPSSPRVLHDTIEDTTRRRGRRSTSSSARDRRAGRGADQDQALDLVSKRAAQAENFRKLLLAIAADVACCWSSSPTACTTCARSIHAEEKRARIAEETLDIYAPLAGRMGMQEMREELEELSFRYSPEAYETITERLNAGSLARRASASSRRSSASSPLFAEEGSKAEVIGRRKRPYSIWKKMERKSVAFEQLSDIFGFRIIVDDIDDCYRRSASSTPPGRWCPAATRTTSRRPSRTTTARSTPPSSAPAAARRAADPHPRDGRDRRIRHRRACALQGRGAELSRFVDESRAYQWLRRTIDLLAEGDNPEEFLEHTKLELFHDQVFCFTPKGRLIALPRGATPIDFAYAVHTDVGNTASAARSTAAWRR
jgi:GTP diphosphokinase / guanosine-3',5'-bis(diphosphate) 3'-diphosphatase